MAGKVTPGQPLSESPFRTAAVVNDVLDATAAFKSGALGRPRDSRKWFPSSSIVVRNDTGADLERGNVVLLGDCILGIDTNGILDFESPWFEGLEPTENVTRIAILLEPIADEGFGLAVVDGVCPVRIEVVLEDHLFAIPYTGETILRSCECGPLELLQPLDGTAEQVVWAKFQHTGYHAKTTSTISAAGGVVRAVGSGTAELYGLVEGELIPTGVEWTVYNSMSSVVADATFIQLKIIGGYPFVDVEDCP